MIQSLPTEGIKIHEHPLATLWFDEEGILHKVSKNVTRTKENVQDLYHFIQRATQGKKVCALVEVSKEGISYPEVREYLKEEIPNTFSAVAFIAPTMLGQFTGTLLSVLAPTHVPTKVFKTEEDGRKWLKEHAPLC